LILAVESRPQLNLFFAFKRFFRLAERIQQLPKRSGEYLFEIIMRRYETKSTMMTSNRPLEDWGKLLGDVPSATAILDRFLHHAEIITITGRSYRLKDKASKKTSKKQAGQS